MSNYDLEKCNGTMITELAIDLRYTAWGHVLEEALKSVPEINLNDWQWYRTDLNSDWGATCVRIMWHLAYPHDTDRLNALLKLLTFRRGNLRYRSHDSYDRYDWKLNDIVTIPDIVITMNA